jgi:hypothetical protein
MEMHLKKKVFENAFQIQLLRKYTSLALGTWSRSLTMVMKSWGVDVETSFRLLRELRGDSMDS